MQVIRFQTPTDKLYEQGVPFDPERVVQGIKLKDPSVIAQQDVDWDQGIEQDDDAAYATASATSHYHYQKLSHLLLCDRILLNARNVPEPVQRVAKLLAQRNAQEIEAWSKYMQKAGGGSICEEQREYYQLLFSQQDVLPVLLGMQTINLAADASYEELQEYADPVFQKLADGFAEENQEAYNEIRDAFQDAIQPLSMEDRMKLLQNVAQQVDLCQMIKQRRDKDIFEPLNSHAEDSLSLAGKKVKQFYNEIGLTTNIF